MKDSTRTLLVERHTRWNAALVAANGKDLYSAESARVNAEEASLVAILVQVVIEQDAEIRELNKARK